MNKFEAYIVKELKRLTKHNVALEVPPDPKLGDYALPCFPFAKALKKAPQAIAADIAAKFKKGTLVQEVKTAGPYLNFFIDKQALAKAVLAKITKDKDTYGKQKGKEKIIIESPGPNTNKPLHLGHVRNMVLGKAVVGLLEGVGHKVSLVNIINDRGIHICKSMLAYQKWGKGAKPDRKGDFFVGDYYVLYNQKLKKHPTLEKEAQEMLRKWEAGDKATMALWHKMSKWALKGHAETYKTFGMQHKKEYYESDVYIKGKDVVLKGLKKDLFEKDEDGAIYVEFEDLPKKYLLRGDGTSLYMTQDLEVALQRYKDFKFTSHVYVVGSEQNLHFQQLFRILDMLGYSWARQCYHLSYGMVYLPEGRMKSREGTVVDADNFVKEIVAMARVEIEKRHGDTLTSREIDKRAAMVGMGAIRFFILKTDPVKDMTYDPNESLSLEGETGPYVQYTHARICSVLKKAKSTGKVGLYEEATEQRVISLLEQYPSKVTEAATHYKPSTLCRYLLDLCQAFNEFYQQIPILKAEKKQKDARLAMLDAVRQVISNGLSLLAIDAPKAM